MHTSKHGDTTFHHNGDYSGDVEIVVQEGKGYLRMTVPFVDLMNFVGYAFGEKAMRGLEEMEGREVLQLMFKKR